MLVASRRGVGWLELGNCSGCNSGLLSMVSKDMAVEAADGGPYGEAGGRVPVFLAGVASAAGAADLSRSFRLGGVPGGISVEAVASISSAVASSLGIILTVVFSNCMAASARVLTL